MSDLPTLLAVLVFIFGAGAGALGAHLLRSWARPRQQPDSGSVGLAEAAARLDGRVSGIHEMVVDLLREQTTAGERLAVVGEQAAELHQTLASHQRRGAWGELLAEDVLRCAGLLDGIHYAKQRTLANGARPDFTFFVADGRTLHLDAKFPLANFRLMEQAESDSERESARKSFLADHPATRQGSGGPGLRRPREHGRVHGRVLLQPERLRRHRGGGPQPLRARS